MILNKFYWVLAIRLLLLALIGLVPAAAVQAEPLRIAFNSGWPPYSSGEGASVDGLLVQLTREIIEKRMGQDIKVVGLPWNRAQHDVENGRLDALITYASPERLKYMNASREILFTLDTKAFVRADSAAELAIRRNPVLKTQRDFMHCVILGDGWSKTFLEKNQIPYQTGLNTQACLRQVEAGRQDVFLHVVETGQAALEEIGGDADIVVLPTVYSSVSLSLLINKKNPPVSAEFLSEFDRVLSAMKKSGSYYSLVSRLRGKPGLVQLATLEWPPYTGEDLPNGGAITETIRRAFSVFDYETMAYFLPWKRAISYAASEKNEIIGYYPGYHCNHEKGFIASRSIGKSELGLAERVDNDITWNTLDDLAAYRIGTVIGYANTEDFDKRVRDKRITVITAHDDKSNLQNLADGQIDLAVVDPQVFKHLTRKYPTLGKQGPSLKMDKRRLKSQELFLCLRDDDIGRATAEVFNAGLEGLDIDAIWQDSLRGELE
ncbi:MAG: transporter substrate-binding domain-containing protein [Alphaproteobacteria bacterium]